jgi:uncharacterized protein YutE (UPF0331/DUF86 family)
MALIAGDLKHIIRLAAMALTDYLTDAHAEILAERYVERTVGRMIDINYHIITESGEAPPRDYYESFLKMGILGMIPVDLARRIASCAGLRNRIVHEYDEIDPIRIHEGLQAAARDIPSYLENIEKRLPQD